MSALPVLGGWTGAGGSLNAASFALFWTLFLWQLPHFLALAWVYREDYRTAQLAMLSVEDPDGLSVLLRDFLHDTKPAAIADQDWGTILARRSPRSRRAGTAAA